MRQLSTIQEVKPTRKDSRRKHEDLQRLTNDDGLIAASIIGSRGQPFLNLEQLGYNLCHCSDCEISEKSYYSDIE